MTTAAAGKRWSDDDWRGGEYRAFPSRRGQFRVPARDDEQETTAAALAKYVSHPSASTVHLATLVLKVLDASETDFRTRSSIARELNVSPSEVEDAVRTLGAEVRSPASANGRFDDWYRLSNRGLTRRERWRRLRSIAGKTAVS